MRSETERGEARAIEVTDVWKRYYLPDGRPGTLKDVLINRFHPRQPRAEIWALREVNLQIGWGRTVGIIGNNGAGKSTLLRLLSGLGRPTRGRVRHNGRMSTLLELGAGFNVDLTGRDNVINGGLISGMTRKEVTERFPGIVDFAELWDFIDAPMRTYSSGMYVRLAFATAINLEPDILIVDEVLAVGDLRYQRKCFNRLLELKQAGKTIVVVSHDMGQIETLCDEVVWLDKGQVRAHGLGSDVIALYRNRLIAPETHSSLIKARPPTAAISKLVAQPIDDTVLAPTATATVPVERACRLTTTRLANEDGAEIDSLGSGSALIVDVWYAATQPLIRPIFSVGIFTDDGTKCYEAVTEADGLYLDVAQGEGNVSIIFSELRLIRGHYAIDVGVYAANWEQTYDYRHNAAAFTVGGETPGSGIFLAPHAWYFSTAERRESDREST